MILGQYGGDCGAVKVIASEHLIEVDRKIGDLQSLRRELAAAVSSCAGRPVAQCRILEAFPPTPEHRSLWLPRPLVLR